MAPAAPTLILSPVFAMFFLVAIVLVLWSGAYLLYAAVSRAHRHGLTRA